MMDPVRSAGIWLGVGAGHAAVVAAVWLGGSGAPVAVGRDAGWITVALLAPAESPSTAAPPVAPSARRAERMPPPAQSSPAVAPAPRVPMPSRPVAMVTAPEADEAMGEPPSFVDRVEPAYPRGARLAGVEGLVRLRLQIGADGTLRQVARVSVSGDEALDRAAEAAARASTYRPARVGGRPVDAEVEASYRFELR